MYHDLILNLKITFTQELYKGMFMKSQQLKKLKQESQTLEAKLLSEHMLVSSR